MMQIVGLENQFLCWRVWWQIALHTRSWSNTSCSAAMGMHTMKPRILGKTSKEEDNWSRGCRAGSQSCEMAAFHAHFFLLGGVGLVFEWAAWEIDRVHTMLCFFFFRSNWQLLCMFIQSLNSTKKKKNLRLSLHFTAYGFFFLCNQVHAQKRDLAMTTTALHMIVPKLYDHCPCMVGTTNPAVCYKIQLHPSSKSP